MEVKDINKLDLSSIKSDVVLSEILELADDDQFEAEPISAREFYEALDALLVKYGGQINGTDVYRKLFAIKIKLFWQSLPAMEKRIKQEALHENVLNALKNNVEIISYVSSYLDIYEYGVGPDKDERQMFLYSITRNEEVIGSQPVKLKTGESVRNTIGNWIKDYLGYQDPNSMTGESYEMTQYLYSSPNVKALNANEKQLLGNVLNIYNLLRNPKYVPEIIKEEDEPAPDQAPVPTPPPPAAVPKPQVPQPPVPTMSFSTPAPISAAAAKDISPFEKKLSQISAPSPSHGVDLESLKKRMESKPVANPVATPNMQEIKREISTKELPAHKELPKPQPPPVPKSAVVLEPKPAQPTAPKPAVPAAPSVKPRQHFVASGKTLTDIRTMEDLKNIKLEHLRRASLDQQYEELKAKILNLARVNRVIPYYALLAFEKSPLFRAYLAHGHSMVDGTGSSELTKEEFEAIADIRKEVQRS